MITGTIIAYAGSAAPDGWLLCDGSSVSRTTYADLFGVIGANGGTGDNMILPDMRGRMAMASTSVLNLAGSESATNTVTNMPNHYHSGGSIYQRNNIQVMANSTTAYLQGNFIHQNTTSSESGASGSSTHSNMPPFLVLNYIIKT